MNFNENLKKVIVFLLFVSLAIPFYVSSDLLFPFISGKGFAFRIIVEIALALWGILACRDPKYRPNWKSPVLVVGGIFILAILISNIFGVDRGVSFWSSYERMDGFVLISHIGAYVLVLSSVFKTVSEWRNFLIGWLVSAAVMSVFAFTQILGFQKINQGGTRVDGTLGNAVYLAGMMLFTIGFSALVAISSKEKWSKNTLLVLSVVSASVLVFTGTRGSVLGLAAGLLIAGILFVIVGRANPYKKIGWVIIGIFVSAVLVWGIGRNIEYTSKHPVLGRFFSISLEDKTIQSRIWNAQIAWQGFLEKPILGWGQGNYNLVFDKYYDPRMHDQEQYFDRTHSIVTDWLIAGGAIGWLAYFALFAVVLVSIWRAENLSRGERVVLVSLLAAYLIHNLAVFDNLISYMQYGTLIALAASLGPSIESRRITLESDSKNLISAISLIALPFVIYFVNIQAIFASKDVIKGIQIVNSNPETREVTLVYESIDKNKEYFEKAISRNSFGTAEAAQQFFQTANLVGMIDGFPEDEKSRFMESALNSLKKIVEDHPYDSKYRGLLGTFYARLGMLPEAQSELEKTIELSSKKQSIRIPLIAVYAASGDMTKAVSFAKETYEINRDNDPSWLTLVKLASRLKDQKLFNDLITEAQASGRHDRVVSYAESIVSANPEEPQNRAALAKALTDAGRYDEAILVLEDAKEDFPNLAGQYESIIKQIKELSEKL